MPRHSVAPCDRIQSVAVRAPTAVGALPYTSDVSIRVYISGTENRLSLVNTRHSIWMQTREHSFYSFDIPHNSYCLNQTYNTRTRPSEQRYGLCRVIQSSPQSTAQHNPHETGEVQNRIGIRNRNRTGFEGVVGLSLTGGARARIRCNHCSSRHRDSSLLIHYTNQHQQRTSAGSNGSKNLSGIDDVT